jgi:hypothetical protein
LLIGCGQAGNVNTHGLGDGKGAAIILGIGNTETG